MERVDDIKLSLSLFILFFFAGCSYQQKKYSGMECEVGKVERNTLITPTGHIFSSQNSQKFFSNSVNFLLSKLNNESLREDSFAQYQLLFEDVAVPIIATAVAFNYEQSGVIHGVYHIQMKLSELLSFFKDQMEQFGWQQTMAIESAECLLSFVKPDRFCTISIRPLKKDFKTCQKMQLIYFIGSN